MSFSSVVSEGNLIPADLLEQIAAEEAKGQSALDFGLDKSRQLKDEIANAWKDARAYWQTFQRRVARWSAEESGTSDTRQHWIVPLFESLGYERENELVYSAAAAVVNGRTYAISHRAGRADNTPPVHIESFRQDLDKRGKARLSPHALLQEYLNSTEHLWGIVTNGWKLRLLRDSSRTSRLTFLEFDLKMMLEGEKFSEFALLYRLIHRSRLPKALDDAPKCWLEQYHQQALEAGGRVREKLRDGVEQALLELGNGFLAHPKNADLRRKFGESYTAMEFYRELLKLVYRLLFLMVAEERKLIAGTEKGLLLYGQNYSVSRLRRLAQQYTTGQSRYTDLWLGLVTTFRLLQDEEGAQSLGISALDGDLFGGEAIPNLETAHLYNAPLLKAVRALSLYADEQTKTLRRVNYAALDVEELGSVYESLLDFRPLAQNSGNNLWEFNFAKGTDRRTTGSYYTRPELVHELIKSALEPVLSDRLNRAGKDTASREKAILDMTVCDPACGSGAFLLAAGRRLGMELARVRSGENQPGVETVREAVRDVITHCIYGVDMNPLAVDLCKLALWLESYNPGKPLSFLDSHIRWGNSLIGATRALVEQGIPDEAFNAISGDNRRVAAAFKRRNKEERESRQHGQLSMRFETESENNFEKNVTTAMRRLEAMPDNTVAAVRAKKAEFARLRDQGGDWWEWHTTFNLWTAAFFHPFSNLNAKSVPTTNAVLDSKRRHGETVGFAFQQAAHLGFFHWELEFPTVFDNGGFDVVLGNPPWERIKLQEREHWVDDAYISRAANRAERYKRITEYRNSPDPVKQERVALFDLAKYNAEAESRFVRASKRFPLTAVGDVNTYALFAELARNLLNPQGRSGVIVPTGIATDDTTKMFFGDLNTKKQLVSLFDFENREKIFADVDSRMKFSLITMGDTQNKPTLFTFFATRVDHLKDEFRSFSLSPSDIALLNPNTRTCPVFRTAKDAELTKKIYQRVPVLINEQTQVNTWGVSFMAMFHMANDSHLFRNQPGDGLVPLYEAKLLWHFTHRWATYQGGDTRDVSREELQNPDFSITPRYWLAEKEVEDRLSERWKKKWLLGFRDITNATNERTAIFSFVSKVAVNHKLPLLFISNKSSTLKVACILTALNSITLDFIARQKIGSTSLSFFILKQFPVLPPSAFSEEDVAYISERVLELVYTTWDMKPFAEDVWSELDETGRQRVVARWQENYVATGAEKRPEHREYFQNSSLITRHSSFDVPPPFIWHEERRAHIRAELDARIARLYGLTRDELRYILDPQDVYGADFPGETFRVLKEKEIRLYGEYRTRRLVLEKWDKENR
jgi:hypothetical protein